jgi:hypothetical protein
MGSLIFLAFLGQTAFLAQVVDVHLDLLAVLVALSAYRWEVRGGLLAGIWSGALASTALGASPLKVIFLYATFGFMAALLFDTTLSDRVGRRAVLAVTLSVAFFVFEAALFASRGMSVLPAVSREALLANAALIFLMLESASWIPFEPGCDRRGGGRDLMRGIVS